MKQKTLLDFQNEGAKSMGYIEYDPEQMHPEDLKTINTASKEDYITYLEERIHKLEDVLGEAVLQIEYLHEKFQETGSGNNVLDKIRAAVPKIKQQEK